MTVRFKSEYQKSFGAPRCSRASPQQRPSQAGLRPDRTVHRKPPKPEVKVQMAPGSPAEPEPPAGPRPPADPEPAGGAGDDGGADKPRPSRPCSQSQPSRPVTSAADVQVQPALRWRAGLRSKGQRSGGQRSEYRRQFDWKTPAAADSPILTAQQVLYSSSRSVPPFKKNPVPQATEYQRSFLGLAPPTGPRLRRRLEQQRAPLFHSQLRSLRKRKPRPQPDTPQSPGKATPPPSPPQVHRRHRTSTEYQSSFRSPLYRNPEGGGATDGHAHQVEALRRQARAYRQRAWGTNFSREHLSQLLSEHNALWEPADSTDPPTPPPPGGEEAPLHLGSASSPESGGRLDTPAGPPAERRTAWEGGGGSSTEEEEGRLPTPRLKTKPVHRTHHDLTTPATGGAILVGKLRSAGDSSPHKQNRGSVVSTATGAEPAVQTPVKPKEAWPEKSPASSSSSLKPASSPPPCRPIRAKLTPPPPAEAPPPLHGIHGTLRHADFQHNGELGLRLREPPCLAGGCGSDEDDRLSVMSWRSAASCSAASEVLGRALKRRDDFWGKA